jgi:hypothetical protein
MSSDASETTRNPAVDGVDRAAEAASLSDASAALRSQATALRSALHIALELQAATVREDDFERAAAELRDSQRAVAERMLDCLRTEEELIARALEYLSDQQAMHSELLERMKLLEGRLESLARVIDDLNPSVARHVAEAWETLIAKTPSEARSGISPTAPNARAEPVSSTVSPSGPRGSRWRPRLRAPRCCTVCRCDAHARSKRELLSAGWIIAGDSSICTDCRSAGWALKEAGGLPFRQRAAGTAEPPPLP